jgi:hypothetical protein
MTSYRAAIASIHDWQLLDDSEIASLLTIKNRLWQDPEWWSVWGVAGLIGADNVKPFLERLRSTQFDWVADALVGNKAPFGNLDVNNMMLESGDPDLITIALATVKMVSICDQFGLVNDSAAIIATAEEMRKEIIRDEKIKGGADRWNVYCAAILLWNCDPATEPTL